MNDAFEPLTEEQIAHWAPTLAGVLRRDNFNPADVEWVRRHFRVIRAHEEMFPGVYCRSELVLTEQQTEALLTLVRISP